MAKQGHVYLKYGCNCKRTVYILPCYVYCYQLILCDKFSLLRPCTFSGVRLPYNYDHNMACSEVFGMIVAWHDLITDSCFISGWIYPSKISHCVLMPLRICYLILDKMSLVLTYGEPLVHDLFFLHFTRLNIFVTWIILTTDRTRLQVSTFAIDILVINDVSFIYADESIVYG